jgi:alpha-tubulin suppressor-like RCC1 family protein
LFIVDGELYLCGFGEHFSPEASHFFHTPKRLEMPEPIRQVACGQSHNLALSTKGNVYSWGNGEYGQLGHGLMGLGVAFATPRLILEGKQVAQVAAGRYHSLALTSAGIMYSWGCGENGQLGLDSDENTALPTVVTPILGTVIGQVACGEHHTAVLTCMSSFSLTFLLSPTHFLLICHYSCALESCLK